MFRGSGVLALMCLCVESASAYIAVTNLGTIGSQKSWAALSTDSGQVTGYYGDGDGIGNGYGFAFLYSGER